MNSSIKSLSDDTIVLTINKNDLNIIFSEDEIEYLLGTTSNIIIPNQDEILEQAKIDSKADNIIKKTLKELTTKMIKKNSMMNIVQSKVLRICITNFNIKMISLVFLTISNNFILLFV